MLDHAHLESDLAHELCIYKRNGEPFMVSKHI